VEAKTGLGQQLAKEAAQKIVQLLMGVGRYSGGTGNFPGGACGLLTRLDLAGRRSSGVRQVLLEPLPQSS